MRLRSSQLVFLMLLVCSVQIRQEYALQLMADAISGRSVNTAQQNETRTASAAPRNKAVPHGSPLESLILPADAVASTRTPWAMPHPASASTAVASHTSLIRA
jgi:hypothetical protein